MATPTLDSCLELVAHQYRREVIRQLRCTEGDVVTFDDLLDLVYRGSSPENEPLPDRDLLAVKLRHIHLPKLAAHDVVQYEPESGSIRYQPGCSVETVLDSLPAELASIRT